MLAIAISVLVTFVAALAFALHGPGRSTVDGRGDPTVLHDKPTASAAASRPSASPPNGNAQAPTQAAVAAPSEWARDFKAARVRFDELRWFSDDTAGLLEMAREADQTLPSLLAQGNIEPGDALLLKADVLEVLEPDETRRVEQLTGWWSEHPLPRPPHLAKGFRYEEALKREQALLLEWQTQPSVDRDAGDLAAELRRLWERHR